MSLLSTDVPFEAFKKSVDKKGFQLISTHVQVIFLLKLHEINW